MTVVHRAASPPTRTRSSTAAIWPTSFALKELTAAGEAKIGALVEKAVS